jgi:hypothetical protein
MGAKDRTFINGRKCSRKRNCYEQDGKYFGKVSAILEGIVKHIPPV